MATFIAKKLLRKQPDGCSHFFRKTDDLHPVRTIQFVLGVLGVAVAVLFQSQACAQDIREALIRNTQGYSPVALIFEVKDSIGSFTRLSNNVFRPSGDGPFPAVVLMHTCGGVDQPHMRVHGRELLENGYVVLMLDSYGPRGIQNCRVRPIASSVGAMDAYAALSHLATLKFVDPARIYQAGYSWGAVTATLLASPQSAEVLKSALRFRATVANYSTCMLPFGGRLSPAVTRDTDRPLLMLLGGKDEELPPESCFPLLVEMQSANTPVQWHVFPSATHGWDSPGMSRNGYVYNEEVAKEATRRMLQFFAENSN